MGSPLFGLILAVTSLAPPVEPVAVDGPAPVELVEPEPAPVLDADEAADTDPKQVAADAFRRAVGLGAEAKYMEAARAFDTSDEAIGSPNAVYNAAYAYEKAEAPVPATSRYRAYLERYPDGEWRTEVEAALGRLSSGVADLDVEVTGANGDPFEIWVDGQRTDAESFPMVLRPGAVQVEVRRPDGEVWETRVLDLYPGSAMSAQIQVVRPVADPGPQPGPVRPDEVVAAPVPDPEAATTGRADRRAKALRNSAIAAGALTGAAGAAVVASGLLALRERERFYAARCPLICETGSYPAQVEQRFESYRAATNVMIGVTAGLGVVTTGIAIAAASAAADRRGSATRTTSAGRVRVRLLPWGLAF